jgi:hypothetical protein
MTSGLEIERKKSVRRRTALLSVLLLLIVLSFFMCGRKPPDVRGIARSLMRITHLKGPLPAQPSVRDIMPAQRRDIGEIINGLLALRNPATGLLPSHVGHPGFERLGFLYDEVTIAMIFKAAGRQKEAERILDYFSDRYTALATKTVAERADTNNIYGIVKLYRQVKKNIGGELHKGLINAFDITDTIPEGRGMLEYVISPGPTSFLVFAMMQVNPVKYRKQAIELAGLLLAMQGENGSVSDADREPKKTHTEPNMDAFDVFVMMYEKTGEKKWKDAADKAYDWFMNNVYYPKTGIIDQGVWEIGRNRVFAGDCYSWTMCGTAADRMGLEALKKTCDYWISHCIVRVTVLLPDGSKRALTLVDFTDPLSPGGMSSRTGTHPMGTMEWTGGAILALQKNAVRFWNGGDKETGGFYKALAEILTDEALKSFYYIKKPKRAYLTFYATGHGIVVGPFGSAKVGQAAAWRTPFFYARKPDGTMIRGGSPVGAWLVLPIQGLNPFILQDDYKRSYDAIPYLTKDHYMAEAFIKSVVEKRTYVEKMPERTPDPYRQIVEPSNFNKNMWGMYVKAMVARKSGNSTVARKYYKDAILWASLAVQDEDWVRLARRDNLIKAREFKGIVWYPWGATTLNNSGKIPGHPAIPAPQRDWCRDVGAGGLQHGNRRHQGIEALDGADY